MKRGAFVLAFAIALGFGSFFGARTMMNHAEQSAIPTVRGSRLPELQWLQNWLHLTDSQFTRVKEFHVRYLPKCEKLCGEMHAADNKVLALSKRPDPVDEELVQALQERAKLAADCQHALLKHLHETAACMNETQSRTFLDRMIPLALGVGNNKKQPIHQH